MLPVVSYVHGTATLPVVSCAWNSVSNIKGRLLQVFKNRFLRKIFGPEWGGGGVKRRLDKIV
jgi:hypothetical protein